MKSFIRKISFLMVIPILVLCLSSVVLAADGNTTITFNNMKGDFYVSPGSVYTDSDLFSSFKGLMPGDTKTESITVKNKCSEHKAMRLYMKTLAHDASGNPLSPTVSGIISKPSHEEKIAESEEFLSKLDMTVTVGGINIFDAKANIPFSSSIPLGVIDYGKEKDIEVGIHVPLDLGNEYADRIGEIDWEFLIEDNAGGIGGGSGGSGGSDGIDSDFTNLTVRKLWSDGNDEHTQDTVTIFLLRDGVPWQSAVLRPENQWSFVFTMPKSGGGHGPLDSDWEVSEVNAIEGYNTKYVKTGQLITIINVANGERPIPEVKKDIYISKKWAEPGKAHPEYVECTLYCNENAVDTVRLSDENNWEYSWLGLEGGYNWQVIESYCGDNFVPSYSVKEKDHIVITNTENLIRTGQLKWPVPVLAVTGILLVIIGILLKKHHEK